MPGRPSEDDHEHAAAPPRRLEDQEEIHAACGKVEDLEALRIEMEARTGRLHYELLEVLRAAEIPVLHSAARTKSFDGILSRCIRTTWSRPVTDIYGARVVLEPEHIEPAFARVQERWPTPPFFDWSGYRLATTRRDPTVNSIDGFTFLRCNLVLDDGHIAEVQFMTPEQERIEHETRAAYERMRDWRNGVR